MEVNYLTGIKPTGRIHIGNYISAIKPTIEYLKENDNKTVYFFIADYHALTGNVNPSELNFYTKNLMVSYCAIFKYFENQIFTGKNNEIYFYRQSQIPEIFELYWILSCYTAKGLLNRNHSYKEIVENNINHDKDPDKSIYMGLFNYPILMASDILMFQPKYVPVGKDQLQHIEITNDIAQKINHYYNKSIFNYIKPKIQDNKFVLLGKDGNKMSKSNNNILPLFSPVNEIEKCIYSIKTNSKDEGEPKYPEESNISEFYKAFATNNQYESYVNDLKNGISWKQAKDTVLLEMENQISYLRRNFYYYYMNNFRLVKEKFEYNEMIIKSEANKMLKNIKEEIGMEVL